MSDPIARQQDQPIRCPWPAQHADYLAYHDHEWGRPTVDDTQLFEKVCLEGFQAGLSWLTILRKRSAFRAAFAGFDPVQVAAFDPSDVERLVNDAGIVRHRGKINSTINNAARALELQQEFGSLAAYFWQWEPLSQPKTVMGDIPALTEESTALSKDLKRRGWSFVGPTTMYAMMQAMGLVNDHLTICTFYGEVQDQRSALTRPLGGKP
ncbi:MAG: DNA-3-methyladenine glycosylase I [Deltaproteobacteria bacterium]